MTTILYIHGLGGGKDSRIPGYLNRKLSGSGINVVVRTYDFDPEVASVQISSWVDELSPDLIIGESMGANHAARLGGVPRLFVSPALGAPRAMVILRALLLIPGVRHLMLKLYPKREGERQPITFDRNAMRGFSKLCDAGSIDTTGYVKAFFGTEDSYRRWGIVSLRRWTKLFGESTYVEYKGTHYMEERFIDSLLIPEIRAILQGRC